METYIFLLKIVRCETLRITCHYSAELQTAKQTLKNSEYLIEFTCSGFPYTFKSEKKIPLVNR